MVRSLLYYQQVIRAAMRQLERKGIKCVRVPVKQTAYQAWLQKQGKQHTEATLQQYINER